MLSSPQLAPSGLPRNRAQSDGRAPGNRHLREHRPQPRSAKKEPDPPAVRGKERRESLGDAGERPRLEPSIARTISRPLPDSNAPARYRGAGHRATGEVAARTVQVQRLRGRYRSRTATAARTRCRRRGRHPDPHGERDQRHARQRGSPAAPHGGTAPAVRLPRLCVQRVSISIRASPMSRSRRFGSFSRQRRSSRRTAAGVAAGRAVQSGSRSRIAAIVSETVSPAKRDAAGQHLVEHAAERPDVGRACRPPARAPARGSCRRRCRGSRPRACRRS